MRLLGGLRTSSKSVDNREDIVRVQDFIFPAVELDFSAAILAHEHAITAYALEATLQGEPPEIWMMLGSERLAAPIAEHRPHIVLHGHAHAGTFAFLLLALAGIPLTSGFMAKFAVFTAGVEGGATPLVIVGVVTSAITAFFYARDVVLIHLGSMSNLPAALAWTLVFVLLALGLNVAVGWVGHKLDDMAGDTVGRVEEVLVEPETETPKPPR